MSLKLVDIVLPGPVLHSNDAGMTILRNQRESRIGRTVDGGGGNGGRHNRPMMYEIWIQMSNLLVN